MGCSESSEIHPASRTNVDVSKFTCVNEARAWYVDANSGKSMPAIIEEGWQEPGDDI